MLSIIINFYFLQLCCIYIGEKYDPLEKTWKPIKSMYAARSNSGIAVIDDMIFVMGGFNGKQISYTTQILHNLYALAAAEF